MDIVVGTSGRLEDFELTKNENLVMCHCRFLVLDEADGLLQHQGHGELINRLHSRALKLTSDGKSLQMIVCSATLHSLDVKKMAVRAINNCNCTSHINFSFVCFRLGSLDAFPYVGRFERRRRCP